MTPTQAGHSAKIRRLGFILMIYRGFYWPKLADSLCDPGLIR